jgi:hypothetical protein
MGKWDESKNELYGALNQFYMLYESEAEGEVWAKGVRRSLLMTRASKLQFDSKHLIIENARHSLEKIKEYEDLEGYGIYLRNYVCAYWLLGAAYRANHELKLAEENLSKALNLCWQLNNVETEADILLELARLHYSLVNYEEAKSLADEALTITERCGYVLQGADVNLFLAQYALEHEKDKAKAKERAEIALKLAYCDGPPYYYKVAYEEAERMLEKLK